MPRKRNSSVSRRKSKAAGANTSFGRDLITAARQILAHVRGEKVLPSYTLSEAPDVKAIRERMGMSQSEFAAIFALNRRTLQQWEQGKSRPDGAVSAYLTVIARNPEAVMQALAIR